MLPIYLSEPSNEPARHRTAATLARQRIAPTADAAILARDRQRAAIHLERLIRQFETTVAAHGVSVFRAATAAAAADRIAAVAAALPVAVTRSAVLAELQDALSDRGVRIVPTYGSRNGDLAGRFERFWQLPPHEAAANWSTRLVDRSPLPEGAGRRAGPRREIVGVFSINAASAESGAIYLLQHSQNIGDLLRTACRLIFVVAIDKIVADDLAARRQTEAIGAYGADSVLLDLARTPRLFGALDTWPPVDGVPPVEVIVLDNGRRDLLRGRYRSLFQCIGCRACATRCPTYPAFRGPRGWSPKDYLWSHLCGNNRSLDLCTLCGNCEVDCPLDIPLPTLIAERRAEDIATRGRGLAGWRRRIHGSVERLDRIFSAAAPLSGCVERLPFAGAVMENVFGLTPQRPLPPFHRDTLERWYRRRQSHGAGGQRPRVVYYFGCFTNYNNPEVGRATVTLLEALGYDVVLPAWRCCGIPLYAKGEIDAARRLAESNITALGAYVDTGCEIVTTCPSCQLALARDYVRLYPSAAAESLAAHTHFLSRFLLDAGGLGGRAAAVPQRAAYHLPCHLRALGMQQDTLQVLREIPGLTISDIARGCCGLSGTFGLERAHYDEAMAIGGGVFAAVRDGGFDLVLSDCGACKLQIEHGTGRQVTHPIEIVSRAVGAGRGARAHAAAGVAA